MKVSAIKSNPKNPRKITNDALEKLKGSIERDPEFMKLRPIVVDENMMVLGGNQRLKAIKSLGMKEIPEEWVIKAENLTEEQRRRFVLVDNAPEGIGGLWDFDELVSNWDVGELADVGFSESLLYELESMCMSEGMADSKLEQSRDIGRQPGAVHVLLPPEAVELLETAISATLESNRASAVIKICKEYLANEKR